VSNRIFKRILPFVVMALGALVVLGGCSTGPVEVKTAVVQMVLWNKLPMPVVQLWLNASIPFMGHLELA